jgi:hypothetical protein
MSEATKAEEGLASTPRGRLHFERASLPECKSYDEAEEPGGLLFETPTSTQFKKRLLSSRLYEDEPLYSGRLHAVILAQSRRESPP